MNFEDWLKKHKKQQNPIGDLARDFIDTNCHTIEESFLKYSPSSEAYETYLQARRAYIIELCNTLRDELDKIMDGYPDDENLEVIRNLQDKLADIDSYLIMDNHDED